MAQNQSPHDFAKQIEAFLGHNGHKIRACLGVIIAPQADRTAVMALWSLDQEIKFSVRTVHIKKMVAYVYSNIPYTFSASL
jgi:hypothetical protein